MRFGMWYNKYIKQTAIILIGGKNNDNSRIS